MITTILQGGLGNQMFQYAIGRVLQTKSHTQLTVDLSSYEVVNMVDNDAKRRYELGLFKLFPEVRFTSKKKSRFTVINRFDQTLAKIISPTTTYMHEESPQFHREVLSLKGNVVLNGFWQSEKYFKTHADILRNDFNFITKPMSRNLFMIRNAKRTQSISIHVRRGDYVHNKNANKFHGLSTPEYYQYAINEIKSKIKKPVWYIFSDDMNWTKTNIKPGGVSYYIDHNHGEKSGEDLRIMSQCKHNIIANSTFSWWGAWLNQQEEKIVIAPKKWFNTQVVNADDICPKEWIKI